MAPSDKELVSALQKGDLEAFKTLYEKHEGPMLRLAMQILNHRPDAEDALQNAFLNLHRKVSGFQGSASFTTWFYRIVVNACLKIREKRRPMERLDDFSEHQAAAPTGDPAHIEAGDALKREIAGLPLRQRMVFTLSEVEGFEAKHVGEILNIKPGTVRFHLFKAKERLRERLRPHFMRINQE